MQPLLQYSNRAGCARKQDITGKSRARSRPPMLRCTTTRPRPGAGATTLSSYNRRGFRLRQRTLASPQEISAFLAGVERRAFKQAMFAVRDEDAALDVVQDAMLKLTEKYADKPAGELPLLFQRILQNAIHDWFRRQKVRNTWVTLFSSLNNTDDDDFDPLETLESADDNAGVESTEHRLEREQVLALIDEEIQKLPARQREAFLMRYWEDMDVAETAAAMGCSEGSVKTHCSRATHTLAHALKAKGITL